jgi:segregation and condensation protein B
MSNESRIEAILFFKNEPVSKKEIAKTLGAEAKEVEEALSNLQVFYQNRGMVIITDGELVSFGTHPSQSTLIETMQKEELSRDLGRAGLETLAIVLYRGPVTRREIDNIRGVNSTFTLRSLMIRGLVERIEAENGERGYSYKSTLKLYEHLGITRQEDLPEFSDSVEKVDEFVITSEETNE